MAMVPVLTEDYQRKLFQFLKLVPEEGEIKSGSPSVPRPTQATYDANKPYVNDKTFTLLTNKTHTGLLTEWIGGSRETVCNVFVGRCGNEIGLTPEKKIGRFDLVDWLSRAGLGHCWVPADSGSTPVYGDIIRLLSDKPDHNGVRLNHIAIVVGIAGDTLYTVDGGQGGPGTGHDIVKRRTREWPPFGLRGWVSMKAMVAASQPLASWVGGWWEVEEEPYETWYYNFRANGMVACTSFKPANPSSPPPLNALVGTYLMKSITEASISWNSGDVDETVTFATIDAAARKYRLTGKTARGLLLTGKRIMTADTFGTD